MTIHISTTLIFLLKVFTLAYSSYLVFGFTSLFTMTKMRVDVWQYVATFMFAIVSAFLLFSDFIKLVW